MVVDIKPEKKYTHGGTFVKYSADGGSFAYYPSGRMAAAMERMGGGFYCYFYADTAKGLTLSAFDPIGVGYCCFPDGSPRLTSAKNGGTYKASQDDNQLRMWSTSKPLSSPISFDLSPNIHIEFGSRQAITAKLTCAGVTEEYQLGDVPKMSGESYLDKVVSQIRMGPERGKYVLDIDKCRQAAVLNRERREAMGMSEIPVTQVHITEDTMQKHVDLVSGRARDCAAPDGSPAARAALLVLGWSRAHSSCGLARLIVRACVCVCARSARSSHRRTLCTSPSARAIGAWTRSSTRRRWRLCWATPSPRCACPRKTSGAIRTAAPSPPWPRRKRTS